MDAVKSIVGTVQSHLTNQASLIYDQVKSAITTKLIRTETKKEEPAKVEPAKVEPAKVEPIKGGLLSRKTPSDTFDSPPPEPEDPDSFSVSRILDMVWYYIQKWIYPLLCVLISSFIANEMIMYSPIIRASFFVFFLLVCLSSTGILSSIGTYYLLKLLYGLYVNKMTDRPKIKLLPTVYSILPLMIDRPLLPIAALFLYPFTYPKTIFDEEALRKTMALYQKDLDRSYPALTNDVTPDMITKAKEYLKHMHDTPKQTEQKGYREELNQIVADPSKFHAPVGQMQMEAAEKAVAAVEVAASTTQKPNAKPALYAPIGTNQMESSTPSPSAPPSANEKQAASTLPPVIEQPSQVASTSLPAKIKLVQKGVEGVNKQNREGTITLPQQVETRDGTHVLTSNPLASAKETFFAENGVTPINKNGNPTPSPTPEAIATHAKDRAAHTAEDMAAAEKLKWK